MNDGSGSTFVRGLGRWDATSIVVGSMIGSGIFISPSLMAGYLPQPWLLPALWLIGGVLTLCAAASFSELAAMFPHAGGQYVYLRRAFGALPAFLYGWTVFLVIQTGFIAAVAIAFAKYLGVFFPALGEGNVLARLALGSHVLTISTAQLVAVLVILLLTAVNIAGVRAGALVQNVFTAGKVLALALLIGAAFLLHGGSWSHLVAGGGAPLVAMPLFAALAVAMSKALFAYDAWNAVSFVAEEVKDPRRDIPAAMFRGGGIVMAIYCLATLAYLYVIPLARMAAIPENRVGAAVAVALLGKFGLAFITAAILVSTFGCVNGLILPGPRLYWAMARDGLFFRGAAAVHPRRKTPHVSLWVQGIWALALVLSGSYSDLLTYTAFASLLFNLLTVAGVLVLRRKLPDAERPYRVIGYPWVPLLYILLAAFFVVYILVGDPLNSGKGLVLVLSGLPVYLVWRRRGRMSAEE